MEILKDAHLTMAEEGRLSVQVPDCAISFNVPGQAPQTPPTQTFSDDYFMYAKHIGWNRKVGSRYRVATGRECGYLHLTRTGFNHFKNDLKAAFVNCRGKTWQEYEDAANKFFDVVKAETQKHLVRMQAEVQIKNTPYNQKRVQECQDALRNL